MAWHVDMGMVVCCIILYIVLYYILMYAVCGASFVCRQTFETLQYCVPLSVPHTRGWSWRRYILQRDSKKEWKRMTGWERRGLWRGTREKEREREGVCLKYTSIEQNKTRRGDKKMDKTWCDIVQYRIMWFDVIQSKKLLSSPAPLSLPLLPSPLRCQLHWPSSPLRHLSSTNRCSIRLMLRSDGSA